MKFGKRTRIISAFPGTGKSYYYDNHKETTLDSDSSGYSWIIKDGKKIRNPEFPSNYISHIKENIGKYDFIFVSSHKEVREALKDNCIFFYLVYPDYDRKDEFVKRYRDRGNPETFIKLVEDNWDLWVKECDFEEFGCKRVRMILCNLEDEINHIIAVEHGEVKE